MKLFLLVLGTLLLSAATIGVSYFVVCKVYQYFGDIVTAIIYCTSIVLGVFLCTVIGIDECRSRRYKGIKNG